MMLFLLDMLLDRYEYILFSFLLAESDECSVIGISLVSIQNKISDPYFMLLILLMPIVFFQRHID
jgi:hypothetical protein